MQRRCSDIKLTNEQLKQLFSGAVCFEQEDGWLVPKRKALGDDDDF